MKTEKRIKVIPEQHKETTVYIAEDGREFYNERDCARYEDKLQTEKHPVFLSHIKNVEVFDMNRYVDLYYFSSKEDHDFFLSKMGLLITKYGTYVSDDFYNGIGWYMYWCESDDYSDKHYIRNCQSYIHELEEDFNLWKTCFTGKINAKMANMCANNDEQNHCLYYNPVDSGEMSCEDYENWKVAHGE